MNQLNLSERGFFMLRRKEELRRQLTGALVAGIACRLRWSRPSTPIAEEKRTIAFVRVDPKKSPSRQHPTTPS